MPDSLHLSSIFWFNRGHMAQKAEDAFTVTNWKESAQHSV